jgi:hypothetical protein
MVKTKRRNNASKTSRRSRRNTRVQRNNNSKRKSKRVRHRKRGGAGDDPKLTEFLNKLGTTVEEIQAVKLPTPPEGLEIEDLKYVKKLLENFVEKCTDNDTSTIKNECVPLLEHLKTPIKGLYPQILKDDNTKTELYHKLATSQHQDYKALANFIILIQAYKK